MVPPLAKAHWTRERNRCCTGGARSYTGKIYGIGVPIKIANSALAGPSSSVSMAEITSKRVAILFAVLNSSIDDNPSEDKKLLEATQNYSESEWIPRLT